MSPYLQRLYDAAGGTATAVEARPAQRSSSPLLAVDQRLASPAYAASFLLGLPGSADPDPDATAPPQPDLLTLLEPVRRDSAPAPGQQLVRASAPPTFHPATSQPEAGKPSLPGPGPVVAPEPAIRPPAAPPETAAEATPDAPVARPAVRPAPPLPTEAQARPVVEPVSRAAAAPLPPPEPRRHHVVEHALPAQPGRLRAVPERPSGPEPEPERPQGVTAPPLLRPAPPKVIDPLPPPPVPRAAETADLAAQVRRLVREAMEGDGTPRRMSRDQQEGPVSDRVTTTPPARTAEAMSVIGPLGRPSRDTTLYGLRLR